MTAELQYTLIAALVVLLLMAAYGIRVALKGRAHYQRVDRQGGSRLLNKGALELGYWILQPVARLLVFLGVAPNMVSWASLVFGFVAAVFLAAGRFGFGAICATISGLLDSLDGTVARLSGVASDAGEVLDAAVDRYVEFFFLSGLVIYYREVPPGQILALLALLGSFMVSYSTTKAEALNVELAQGGMRRPERAVYLTLGAALSALTIPWLEDQGATSLPIGYPMMLTLGLVALLANVTSIRRFCSIAKIIRNRERDPAEDPRSIDAKTSEDSARARKSAREVSTRLKRPGLPLTVSLTRSQLASLAATIADFGCLFLLVEVGRVWYVAATMSGALLGAIVNFLLGRHWTFRADDDQLHGQAVRYAVVSAISLLLNSLGVYLLTDYFAIHYMISRVVSAFLVGILFNFPLHRRFVFRRQTYA